MIPGRDLVSYTGACNLTNAQLNTPLLCICRPSWLGDEWGRSAHLPAVQRGWPLQLCVWRCWSVGEQQEIDFRMTKEEEEEEAS